MANPTVVDELIVTLTLDAEPYSRAERRVEREADRTFRNQQDRARRTDRSNRDRLKSLKEVAAGVKSFTGVMLGAVGIVTGLGVAVGGVLTGLLNFDTGLRRQAVGTGLSNRQMQAWGSTARRMGADAQAGAEAIANLAREQRRGVYSGQAPTLVALSKMGINAGPGRAIEDILSDAQRMYRAAPAGQQRQIEDMLGLQGVSDDLILMIKSETNVRDAYTKSLEQAREENEKASAAWADTLETLKNAGIEAAGILQDTLAPAIEAGANKLVELAGHLDKFATDVRAAGGGINGFMAALVKHFPDVGDAIEVAKNETNKATAPTGFFSRLYDTVNRVRAPWGNLGILDDLKAREAATQKRQDSWWRGRVAEAKANSPGSMDAVYARNLEGGPRNIDDGSAGAGASFAGGGVSANAQSIMTELTSKYGLSVAQAAAVVANWQGETGVNFNHNDQFNAEGGGTGARGIAQWRGARSEAFKRRYGRYPNMAPIGQQIEFAMTDPYERGLLMKSFAAGGNDPAQLGESVSRIYEGHGKVYEDAQRGRVASQLASGYGSGSTSTVNIQNMTVQTNDPAQLVEGLQRIPTTQPFNTVVR